MKHLIWLWSWFMFGSLAYMTKRAFYLIKGPSPVANDIRGFIHVAGVPLGFRLIVESGIYWACFTPQVLQSGLAYLGWSMAASVIADVTRFGVFALFFGLGLDPMMDWGIGTVVEKIPFLSTFWPQMPPPITAPAGRKD